MPSTGVNGRNAAYAVQWWVFAAFALFLWVKMVHQAHREEIERDSLAAAADASAESTMKEVPHP